MRSSINKAIPAYSMCYVVFRTLLIIILNRILGLKDAKQSAPAKGKNHHFQYLADRTP